MKIYWTIDQIPELTDFKPKVRRKIYRICYLEALRDWRNWLYFLPLMLNGVVVFPVFGTLFHFTTSPSLSIFLVISIFLISIILVGLWSGLVSNIFIERAVLPLIKLYLLEKISLSDKEKL